ncbi:hypothetical protein B9Q13_05145 [Candidatus Marsarchaeota G2 archaeon ECH_B_SAG-G16]|uniref:3-phosphoglycerate dehydrogenase n=4 Tax=Candidatus Marsarchaeota TaxID=1978152 RepID=A0A2R6AJL4_9ARCH|nr:MAG: hypothetical protein B9Q01_00245 [Candidatus Marsarchaeota G1 archaeon OSP_D]PSN86565.1 MAG: hypothetical protein B9Q02_01690 [Candidatus Marsarchaeota G1 archaeon BE_D]PSN89683.1 MAG: hypothetical protein B9Q00_00255 [Candidatus Marsarchaeota G1 archaeon OSP_C]PSO04272.1 MAG: hypothetical protein B9Q13_05145 [Candidatus Marsarchaeota G2 archaeon ECH_B_SAG-G16]
MKKIVLCDKVDEETIKPLKDKFLVVDASSFSKEELLKEVEDAHCIVVRSRTKVDAQFINRAKNLELIARAGVGLDNIDIEIAQRRGIKVINTPAAPTTSAAELTFGLILDLLRGISRGDRGIRQGKWLKNDIMGYELKGKILGIVGYGRIGSQVATYANCFGMKVYAWDILGPEIVKAPALYVELDGLLGSSDIVTLHVPLTNETRKFLNRERIAKMKNGAFLINASRGEVVDEEALYEALVTGKLAGAALDVFSKEPYEGPLTKLENVVLTPHIGANTFEAQRRSAQQLVELILQNLG